MSRLYVTTAIPYVNAEPQLGHALELVQVDVVTRHRRRQGWPVRSLTGTDDNAFKNVAAARAAGVPVRKFVEANAAQPCRHASTPPSTSSTSAPRPLRSATASPRRTATSNPNAPGPTFAPNLVVSGLCSAP